MPESLAEAKGSSNQREQQDDGGGSKHSSEGRDAKHGPCGDPPWNADPKEGKGRGRVLSSLSKPTSPHLSETPTLSLPSPAADSGRLAPLDMGHRSPRSQGSPRLSFRSNSPQNPRDRTTERPSLSLPPSEGSSSPRSGSPRLPPMKSAPSPPPSQDDASLPGLGPPPRSGAHSARRVRSLPPSTKRASRADPTNPTGGTSLELVGGRGGSGSDGRFSPLLDAKEKEPRRGLSDPAVEGGGRRISRNGEGGGRARAGSVGIEVAEAKHGRSRGSQDRLPETKLNSQPHDRREGRRRSSQRSSPGNESVERLGRPGAERLAPATVGKTRKSLSNGNGNGNDNETNGGDSFPGCRDRDEKRYNHQSEEKDAGGVPNSPSTARGEESSKSPRTRRMRPQRDSTT